MRAYGPPLPTGNVPAIFNTHGSWSVYQAPGAAQYILEDTQNALDDYAQDDNHLFPNPPIKMQLSALYLRPAEGTSLNVEMRQRVNQILDEFSDRFSEQGSPTPYAEHRIDTGNHAPISSPPYRLTPNKQQMLKKEIEAMLRLDIIEECDSAWASPIVLVPKPDGKIRLCVDYRKLNAVTKPDMYPLPRIDDLLQAIGPIGCMSTLDLQAGYWQIQVRREDRDKTAFICPFGLYRFSRMAFGLKGAPASFQRLIDRFRAGLPDVKLFAYLDDLIIISDNQDKHLVDLRLVMTRLRKFQLRINRNKCTFGCNEIRYLGHLISPTGISTNPDKISAVTQMSAPTNQKELQSFLQTCSWFRRFIENFADVTRPLSTLLKKDTPWSWGPAQEQSFQRLKILLTTTPILRTADPSKPFILRTDSSAYALGAALLQGEGPEERPVEYASRLLTSAEQNYSTTERAPTQKSGKPGPIARTLPLVLRGRVVTNHPLVGSLALRSTAFEDATVYQRESLPATPLAHPLRHPEMRKGCSLGPLYKWSLGRQEVSYLSALKGPKKN